jgi:Fur family transcriptional regulator, stress-responsive regulator
MTAADADRIRSAGLRVTAARLAILDAVRAGHHPGADEIALAVRDRIGQVSRQGVSEALTALAMVGLIRRIEPARGPARYEGPAGDEHSRVVCRRCGTAADVDLAEEPAPCLETAAQAGFTIDRAEVTFRSLCPDCQAQGTSA